LKWFQNSGGWSGTSQFPSVLRGENTRSFARVASSSRRMPANRPSNPCLASASFNPSVFRAAERAAGGSVASFDRGAAFDNEVEGPLFHVVITERVHLRKFLASIDMQCGERHAAKKRFPRQPDHDVGVLAERPKQTELTQPGMRLAEDVDALSFEFVQPVHGLLSC
jgi:hypothetical protein